jgi:hypothetical protein
MKNIFYFLTVLIFLIEGCAHVEITRITSQNQNAEGIRFYRPYPYLLVTKAKEGENLECKIVYLPNTNENYAINIKSGIGTAETKFTLENGWNLTGYGETRDSKTVEMITALTGSLKDLTGMYKMTSEEELRPGLYVFIFDDRTGLISDLKPVIQFK